MVAKGHEAWRCGGPTTCDECAMSNSTDGTVNKVWVITELYSGGFMGVYSSEEIANAHTDTRYHRVEPYNVVNTHE